MKCPVCGSDSKVIDIRHDCECNARVRECKNCKHRFYTAERECNINDFYELEYRRTRKEG